MPLLIQVLCLLHSQSFWFCTLRSTGTRCNHQSPLHYGFPKGESLTWLKQLHLRACLWIQYLLILKWWYLSSSQAYPHVHKSWTLGSTLVDLSTFKSRAVAHLSCVRSSIPRYVWMLLVQDKTAVKPNMVCLHCQAYKAELLLSFILIIHSSWLPYHSLANVYIFGEIIYL